jgi:hypothetical protein
MFSEMMPKKHPKQEAVDKGLRYKEDELRNWIEKEKAKKKHPNNPSTLH